MKLRSILVALALFVALGTTGRSVAATGPADGQRTWQVDGTPREGLVIRPGVDVKRPTTGWPVVLVFHGHGGADRQIRRQWAIEKEWPEAVVVYLHGLPTKGVLTDPDGRRNGWDIVNGPDENKDVRFFDVVLKSLLEAGDIDATRVFATGHSNGGAFTYLLWSCRADALAAVAPSASVLAGRNNEISPKPALIFAGTKDELVKYAWQEKMIQRVLKTNACAAESTAWETVGQWHDSKADSPTVLVIYDGGHTPPKNAGKLVATFFKSISATRK